jgi:uncharacterized protein DUF29
MVSRVTLPTLYQQDETAWLEEMARLAGERRVQEMDLQNLSEFLSDMARRDRREVYSRLVILLAHLLKWEYQPDRRTGSWRGTIRSQRLELRLLLESGTLRQHAAAILPEVHQEARALAADETGLPIATFPTEFTQSVDELLAEGAEPGNG